MSEKTFTFEISLSVLNHLGRNLYRSFATILGEAISNSWDADAKNVWIDIDRDNSKFTIMDDGMGMTADGLQNKFLKIGYSKRKDGSSNSVSGRPFIGRKGIGKLALLSCAQKISVLSKTNSSEYVGVIIDNSQLDEAIDDEWLPQQLELELVSAEKFSNLAENHEHGTIIEFDGIRGGIWNQVDYLKQIIARYFRFSVLDKSFTIYVNGSEITIDELRELAKRTEFLWNINNHEDLYVTLALEFCSAKEIPIEMSQSVRGFIASVDKPSSLKIPGVDEKAGVDLFVNGRLRQRDILSAISRARIPENYLYGQIHFDDLDDEEDRFTSSREEIVADDPKYTEFIQELSVTLGEIIHKWDELRRKHDRDGDPDNKSIKKRHRKSQELYNMISSDYKSDTGDWVDKEIKRLQPYASFNVQTYIECFLIENLARDLISRQGNSLSKKSKTEVNKWRKSEVEAKARGNVNINIRADETNDLNYLDFGQLARNLDDVGVQNTLVRDAKTYKPIRDAVMHTSLLTQEAKYLMKTTYNNIKGRIRNLFSSSES